MVQHRDIPDAQRHEPKGASTASAGFVLSGNGDGTTSFVDPVSLTNVELATSLVSQSMVDQSPSAVDTPLQVVWGTGASNENVDVASNGMITFLDSGLYFVSFNLNFGRTSGAGTAILVARWLYNGVQSGVVHKFSLSDATASVPFSEGMFIKADDGDTIVCEIMRDSAGIDNGGLFHTDVTDATWANAPSASVRIQYFEGAA